MVDQNGITVSIDKQTLINVRDLIRKSADHSCNYLQALRALGAQESYEKQEEHYAACCETVVKINEALGEYDDKRS